MPQDTWQWDETGYPVKISAFASVLFIPHLRQSENRIKRILVELLVLYLTTPGDKIQKPKWIFCALLQ